MPGKQTCVSIFAIPLEHSHACKTTLNITKCLKYYTVFIKEEREMVIVVC